MLRGLAVVLAQLLLTPPFAMAGILLHVLRPRAELIPRVGRMWCRILLAIGGTEVVAIGADIAARHRPAIVVGNHASHLDVYVAATVLPQPIRFVAKSQLFRIPFFGQALAASGMVRLERRGEQADIDRLGTLHAALDLGAVVVFFPEGTRQRDGKLGRFKKGAFVTAIQAGVPVIPMVIEGAHLVHPPGSIRFYPGRVVVRLLPPVPTEGLTIDDRDRLIQDVRERFIAVLPESQRPATTGPGP